MRSSSSTWLLGLALLSTLPAGAQVLVEGSECDVPETQEIEYCCVDPLDPASCLECDDPTSAVDECGSTPPASDSSDVIECPPGVICTPPEFRGTFTTHTPNLSFADLGPYVPPPPPSEMASVKPAEIVVMAVPNPDPSLKQYLIALSVTGDDKQQRHFVLTGLNPKANTKYLIGEQSFVKSDGTALSFDAVDSNGSKEKYVVVGADEVEHATVGNLSKRFRARLGRFATR